MKRRQEMTLFERMYLFEVIRGLGITMSHLIGNFAKLVLRFVGLRKQRAIATYQYPEEQRPYPPRYRGRHRLTLHTDGSVRCTACFLCATACPARCIYIQPVEHEDPSIEKYPARYEIDTLLCVYCGYCVEACPVDAIRMDTGIHPEIYIPDPRAFVEDKETLMERSRILQGSDPESILYEHRQKMKKMEESPLDCSVD